MAAALIAYDAQETAVDAIFSWSPILWGIRIVALLVVAGAGLLMLVLFIRLLRPSHLRELIQGDLSAIRKGRFSVMGQEIEISTGTDDRYDEQFADLVKQVKADHDWIDKLAGVIDDLVAAQSEETR